MDPSISLRQATAQDLQLELLRRTAYNALRGEEVAAGLLRHRDLWLAAILDRPGVPDYSSPGRLSLSGLIKLRDLPGDGWSGQSGPLGPSRPRRQAGGPSQGGNGRRQFQFPVRADGPSRQGSRFDDDVG